MGKDQKKYLASLYKTGYSPSGYTRAREKGKGKQYHNYYKRKLEQQEQQQRLQKLVQRNKLLNKAKAKKTTTLPVFSYSFNASNQNKNKLASFKKDKKKGLFKPNSPVKAKVNVKDAVSRFIHNSQIGENRTTIEKVEILDAEQRKAIKEKYEVEQKAKLEYMASPLGQAELFYTLRVSDSDSDDYKTAKKNFLYSINDFDNIISTCENWMSPETISGYIGEDYDKWKNVSDWTNKSSHFVSVPDYENHNLKTTPVWKDGASFPFWVEDTPENREKWKMYTHYINYSYAEGNADFNEYMTEYNEKLGDASIIDKIGWGGESKAALTGGKREVDSVFDVGRQLSKNARYGDNIIDVAKNDVFDIATYFRDYWVNPVVTGHFGTFLWNRVWGTIDDMDTLTGLPIRAIRAGHLGLGGYWDSEEGSFSEGQEVYWYSDRKKDRDAQKFYMKAGGRELHTDATHLDELEGTSKKDVNAIINKIQVAFNNSKEFKDYNAREIYEVISAGYGADNLVAGFKRSVKNFIDAYSHPGDNFYTDTGSLAVDIMSDSVMDVSLSLGGLAKGFSKGATKQIAREAVAAGFEGLNKEVRNNAARNFSSTFGFRSHESIPDKEIRKANAMVNRFYKNNGEKDILFKNLDEIEENARFLAYDLSNLNSDILDPMDKDVFVQGVMRYIQKGQLYRNNNIVNSMSNEDTLAKAAYKVNEGLDKIDMLSLKVSLPEPFIMAKMVKGSKFLFNQSAVGKAINANKLERKQNMAREYIAKLSKTNEATVTDIKEAINKVPLMDADASTVGHVYHSSRAVVDRFTVNTESISKKLCNGDITPEEAEVMLTEEIRRFAGDTDIDNFDDLAVYIKEQQAFRNGDLAEAFNIAKSSHDLCLDVISEARNGRHVDFLHNLENVTDYKSFEKAFVDYYATQPKLSMLDAVDVFEELSQHVLKYDLSLEEVKGAIQSLSVRDSVTHTVTSGYRGKASFENVGSAITDIISDPNTDFKFIDREATDVLEVKIKSSPNINARINSGALRPLARLLENETAGYSDIADACQESILNLVTSGIPDAGPCIADLRLMIDHYRSLDFHYQTGSTVYQLDIDKLTFLDSVLNDRSFVQLRDIYNTDIKDGLREVLSGLTDIADDESLALINTAWRIINTYDRIDQFDLLIASLRPAVSGLSNEQMWVIMQSLFSFFSSNPNEVLVDCIRNPHKFMQHIDTACLANFGESKLGMASVVSSLATCNSPYLDAAFFGKYAEEVKNNPALQKRILDLVNGNSDDPLRYAKLQLIQEICLDNNTVLRYNKASITRPQIIYHISTSGLDPNISSIRSIACLEWKHIDENEFTLEKLFDEILDNADCHWQSSVKVHNNDLADISDEFLDKVFNTNSVERSWSREYKLEQYRKLYGTDNLDDVFSEEDLINSFIEYVNSKTISYSKKHIIGFKKVNRVYPSLIVHDFEGFNFPFLRNRINHYVKNSSEFHAFSEFPIYDLEKLSNNSFESLRLLTDDRTVSFSQKNYIIKQVKTFCSRISGNADNFTIMDPIALCDDLVFLKNNIQSLQNQTQLFNGVSFYALFKIEEYVNKLKVNLKELASLNNYAKQHYIIKTNSRGSIISGYLDIPDEELAASISNENYEAMSNLANALNLDLHVIFKDANWGGQYKSVLKEIFLNASFDTNLTQILIHELSHAIQFEIGGIRYNSFKDLLVNKIKSYYDNPETKPIIEKYFKMKKWLYEDIDIDTEGIYAEIVAQVISYYFTENRQALTSAFYRLKEYCGDHEILFDQVATVFESFDTLIKNNFRTDAKFEPEATQLPFSVDSIEKQLIIDLGLDHEIKDYFVKSFVKLVTDRQHNAELLTSHLTYTNHVRKASTEPVSIVNNLNKYDTDAIDSLFYIGGNPQRETLQKMQDMSAYVSDYKKSGRLSDVAEEFLKPYKESFDAIIRALQNEISFDSAIAYNFRGYEFENALEYITLLKTPTTAIDSYLICQKLYDDVLSLWLDMQKDMDYTKLIKKAQSGELTENQYNYLRDGLRNRLVIEFVDGFSFDSLTNALISDGSLKRAVGILSGEHHSTIFNNKLHRVISMKNGEGRYFDGARKVRALREVISNASSSAASLSKLNDYNRIAGISTLDDYRAIMASQHIAEFQAACPVDDDIFAYWYETVIEPVYLWRLKYLNLYHSRKLMVDGVYSEERLISELLFNGFYHMRIDTRFYAADELNSFTEFLDNLEAKYIDYFFTDDQQLVIRLLDNVDDVSYRVLDEKLPYGGIGKTISWGDGFTKEFGETKVFRINEYEAIPFPTVDELFAKSVDEDIVRFYNAYIKLYDDVDNFATFTYRLSTGENIVENLSRGTLGHVITEDQYLSYFHNLPDTISKGMMKPNTNIHGRTIFDPGFITSTLQTNLYDAGDFVNLFYSINHFYKRAETPRITANYMFNNSVDNNFATLVNNFSDREVFEAFRNSDGSFVIVDLRPANNKNGFEMYEEKIEFVSDVQRLRSSRAIVLPYDVYHKLRPMFNDPNDNFVFAFLNKALLVTKAFALCRPSTWVTNYIDAFVKAGSDSKGGAYRSFGIFSKQLIALRNWAKLSKMKFIEKDNITLGDWDRLVSQYNLGDISYEDYLLLKGLTDSNSYMADSVIASSSNARIVNTESDINIFDFGKEKVGKLYSLTFSRKDMRNAPMNKKDYLRAYNNRSDLTDGEIEAFNSTTNMLLAKLESPDASLLNRAVKKIFIPFNISEILARYSQLLYLKDEGLMANERLKRIHATQFDSTPVNKLSSRMELVFPFINYDIKNIMFWFDMIEKNPRLFKYFQQTFGNIYEDNVETSMSEYGTWDYLSDYKTKKGGVNLPFGKGLYFKVGPSLQNAMSLFFAGPDTVISNLNPFLQYICRRSLYFLGFNSNEFFSEVDLDFSDETFLQNVANCIPGVSEAYDRYSYNHGDKSFVWENVSDPLSQFFVKLCPRLFGANLDINQRQEQSFEDYQKKLAKDGLWYDCNLQAKVDLSEKNEFGLNDPNLSFEDRKLLMFQKFGVVYDSNTESWVAPSELTSGGLNQELDFDNDPNAWEKLTRMYALKGYHFDQNLKQWVQGKVSAGGLNDPDIDFPTVEEEYRKRFGLYFDSNQNKFVSKDAMIEGGLNSIGEMNSIGDWIKIRHYRDLIFGEEYFKEEGAESGHFEKTHEPSVVTLYDLVDDSKDENYFTQLGIARISKVMSGEVTYKDGFFVTRQGKYVLLKDEVYNNRVLDYLSSKLPNYYGVWNYRNYGSWHSYKDFGNNYFYKRPYNKSNRSNFSSTDYGFQRLYNYEPGYYSFNFKYNYQYRNPSPTRKIYRSGVRQRMMYNNAKFDKFAYYH